MKTGFAKICINPPYGAPIVGYYEQRYVKGILDDLFVRVVAFDDGERQAAVIALDLCILAQKYYEAFKDAIVAVTGMDRDAIFINCSHTHTGPLVGNDFASGDRSTQAYDDFFDCLRARRGCLRHCRSEGDCSGEGQCAGEEYFVYPPFQNEGRLCGDEPRCEEPEH